MPLNMMNYVLNKSIKLNDTFRMYIKRSEDSTSDNDVECIEILKFTPPKMAYKEEVMKFGNNSRIFQYPDYDSPEPLKIELYDTESRKTSKFVSELLALNFDFDTSKWGYTGDYLYEICIEILDNEFGEVLATYTYRYCKLINYSMYNLSYQDDSPVSYTLEFSYMYAAEVFTGESGPKAPVADAPFKEAEENKECKEERLAEEAKNNERLKALEEQAAEDTKKAEEVKAAAAAEEAKKQEQSKTPEQNNPSSPEPMSVDDAKKAKNKADKKLGAANAEVTELEKQLKNLEFDKQAAQNSIDSAKKELAAQLREQAKNDPLSENGDVRKNNPLNATINGASSRLKEDEKKIEELQEKLDAAKGKQKKAQKEVNNAKSDLKEAKAAEEAAKKEEEAVTKDAPATAPSFGADTTTPAPAKSTEALLADEPKTKSEPNTEIVLDNVDIKSDKPKKEEKKTAEKNDKKESETTKDESKKQEKQDQPKKEESKKEDNSGKVSEDGFGNKKLEKDGAIYHKTSKGNMYIEDENGNLYYTALDGKYVQPVEKVEGKIVYAANDYTYKECPAIYAKDSKGNTELIEADLSNSKISNGPKSQNTTKT